MMFTLGYFFSHVELEIVTAVVAILGVGRLTRGFTYDSFPPSVWWRMTWAKITHDGPWEKLFTCWWCLSPWIMFFCIGWFLLGFVLPGVMIAWWIFWLGLGLSYVSAIIISRDTPPE